MEASLRPLFSLLFLFVLTLQISEEVSAGTTMTMYNKCSHPVWPGIQPGSGKPILAKGGFKLLPNKSYTLQLPPGWSGRVWGRHGCSFDASGRGRCATGDCGGALFCNGLGGTPPATLAEITLGNDQDFYDVSLVDGYNLAISITPFRGSGKCSYAGCVSDLNMMCPVGLQVRSHDKKSVVACKSACFAFNSPRYCCTGSFGNPQSCKPTAYSRIFKAACPKAYSYAYDDPTSIATCTGGSYLLTFCPHH
ncbi:Pathogenesis-related thaumatin superfamily protein [Perilla frutescens var. hirtella]|uniref:Pathogenesis-related thaumatin superfamily protein n=1 Tax=Perilla frutescens var. hirtella TaxID=608512 RepID=A0AAD4IVS9_PERFH|nr:Pathogenesis-related thaumatin superfamily protein [Perilla frutescens var. hirtella]KAH6822199.1 Pathogenesis-related thaumatin superfamily protein [Perilla frutescens var. hirtella]